MTPCGLKMENTFAILGRTLEESKSGDVTPQRSRGVEENTKSSLMLNRYFSLCTRAARSILWSFRSPPA